MCIPSKCAPCPNVYHKNVHPVRMYITRMYILSECISQECTPCPNVYQENIHNDIFHIHFHAHSIYISIYIPCTFPYTFHAHSILHHSFVLLCTFPRKVLVDTFVYRRVRFDDNAGGIVSRRSSSSTGSHSLALAIATRCSGVINSSLLASHPDTDDTVVRGWSCS